MWTLHCKKQQLTIPNVLPTKVIKKLKCRRFIILCIVNKSLCRHIVNKDTQVLVQRISNYSQLVRVIGLVLHFIQFYGLEKKFFFRFCVAPNETNKHELTQTVT